MKKVYALPSAPPTNQSIFHQWTVGPIYYTSLVMAEVLGASNQAQVLDLQPNNNSPYTPAYAIYEDGDPVRVALFNYVTDPSGASDVTATIKLNASDGSSALPTQVKVKSVTFCFSRAPLSEHLVSGTLRLRRFLRNTTSHGPDR